MARHGSGQSNSQTNLSPGWISPTKKAMKGSCSLRHSPLNHHGKVRKCETEAFSDLRISLQGFLSTFPMTFYAASTSSPGAKHASATLQAMRVSGCSAPNAALRAWPLLAMDWSHCGVSTWPLMGHLMSQTVENHYGVQRSN